MNDNVPVRTLPLMERTRVVGRDLDEMATDRQRVLVVEDEPDTVLLLKNILRMAGYDVLSASNGQEALKKYKDHIPDIVLLDLYWYEEAKKTYGDVRKAVDISLDALKGMRKDYPDLPVIQYTVKPDKETMESAYEAGATFFLEKVPMAIAEVQSALKYIMIYLMRNR